MTVLATILSSLALLAATADLILTLWERKRSKERNTALMQYADTAAEKGRQELSRRLEDLEKGIVPDFEKAKEAANAVNSFNAGITGILGYDPYAALQAQRSKDLGGDHS